MLELSPAQKYSLGVSMRISDSGKALIKKFEGVSLKAYRCPAGIWTIGYGHTGSVDRKPVKPGMIITKDKVEELLNLDLIKFEKAVTSLVKVPLSQNQFDALVSFVFNVGIGNFQQSTLLKLLNEKKYKEAGEQFKRWVYVDKKKILPGLVKRREAEAELFNRK